MEKICIFIRRLTLAPLTTRYLHTVNEYATDPENTRFMKFLPNDSIDETLEFLKNSEAEWQKEHPEFFEFVILLGDNEGEQIGAVSLYLDEEDPTKAEFGWILNKKYWRQGYAFEAAKAVMDYAIQNLGVRHFIAHCDSENVGSYKVMEKLGMKRTSECGGRRNRQSEEERREFQYEKEIYPVRVMTMDDYDKVYALWRSTPNMGLNSHNDSREGTERYLKRNPTTCFVAESGEKIVGVILSGHDGRRGMIYHMAVDTAYQRKGIATDLLTHALDALKEEGIIKVALVVFKKNEEGNAFWEKNGFFLREDIAYRNKELTKIEYQRG